MKVFVRSLAIAGAASLLVAATGNWLATIVQTPNVGHRMGNPDAEVKITEYVSYTCPHCAEFEKQSEGAKKLMWVQPGKASVEVRHLVRDPIDLTVAMLANCGPKEKFFQNHTSFMLAQPEYLDKAIHAGTAQQSRWKTGTGAARRKAIASDLELYDIMEMRGYSRVEADKCLADEAMATKLAEATANYTTKLNIHGTPSFAINGKVQQGVHTWLSLQTAVANTK